jgi:site-specific DNA-methyltransferase (adenine-specific)
MDLQYGTILCGDCLEKLKELEDNSIDSCVTDPPYGLSKEPNIVEVMQHWINGDIYEHKSKGFMGKSWDSFVPGPEYWKEISRVLKPGGYLLAFSGSRTWDLLSIAIRFAGFENRDTIRREYVEGEPEAINVNGDPIDIISLSWNYGSGFPKSLNISKELDKKFGKKSKIIGQRPSGGGDNFDAWRSGEDREDRPENHKSGTRDILEFQTDIAKKYEGYGTALKPAQEVILVFRKPLKGTVAENILQYGTGGLNIDGCRIQYSTNDDSRIGNDYSHKAMTGLNAPYIKDNSNGETIQLYKNSGRWPANLILSHHPNCKPLGEITVKNKSGSVSGNEPSTPIKNTYGEYDRKKWNAHGDEHGLEHIEDWKCVDGCPIKEMNSQSGIKQSGAMKHKVNGYESESNTGFIKGESGPHNQHGDCGGAARFFLNTPSFKYVVKVSKKERELGCDSIEYRTAGEVTGGRKENSDGLNSPRAGAGRNSGSRNDHPTLKPLDLLQWLVRLVTPENGIVLDPFMGSGSTAMAAVLEHKKYVGVELNPHYFEIAQNRISYIEDNNLTEINVKHKYEENEPIPVNFFEL